MNDATRFFKQHQEEIIKFANTKVGRFLLNSRIDAPIIKISPTAIIYDWKPCFRGEFYLYERQAKILMPIITKLLIAKEHNLERQALRSLQSIGAIPFVLLNERNIYVTGGDGGLFGAFPVYTTARELASATGSSNSTNGNEFIGGNYTIYRGFFPVLLSDIGKGSVVASCKVNLWVDSTSIGNSDDTSQFIQTTQSNPASLASGDYSQITLNSPISFGTTPNWSLLPTGAYSQFTLNSTALTYLTNQATTYAKIGNRATRDINATTPGGQPSNINYLYSNSSGTSMDPYYDIIWVGGGGFII